MASLTNWRSLLIAFLLLLLLKYTWYLTSTETVRLIRDGKKRGKGYRGWGRGRLYTYRDTVTTRMTPALRWAVYESHFNVSLIVRDKVTRQCPQTTIVEEKGEPNRIRTEVPLLTSLTPYRWAKSAHKGPCVSALSIYLYWLSGSFRSIQEVHSEDKNFATRAYGPVCCLLQRKRRIEDVPFWTSTYPLAYVGNVGL